VCDEVSLSDKRPTRMAPRKEIKPHAHKRAENADEVVYAQARSKKNYDSYIDGNCCKKENQRNRGPKQCAYNITP
jgi:hypothetical protein